MPKKQNQNQFKLKVKEIQTTPKTKWVPKMKTQLSCISNSTRSTYSPATAEKLSTDDFLDQMHLCSDPDIEQTSTVYNFTVFAEGNIIQNLIKTEDEGFETQFFRITSRNENTKDIPIPEFFFS